MWDRIAAEVAAEFPNVSWDTMLVDAMTMRMTLKPSTLETIVATNLHADILSDLAAALAGPLGIAPTANLKRLAKPQSFVAKYEHGERRLSAIELIHVARALGVEPVVLLRQVIDIVDRGER